MQVLARRGIAIGAHIAAIGGIPDEPFDPVHLTREDLLAPGYKPFPVRSDAQGEAMQARIAQVKAEGDSVGGLIQCAVLGLPPGLGMGRSAPRLTTPAAFWAASAMGCPCSFRRR